MYKKVSKKVSPKQKRKSIHKKRSLKKKCKSCSIKRSLKKGSMSLKKRSRSLKKGSRSPVKKINSYEYFFGKKSAKKRSKKRYIPKTKSRMVYYYSK